MILDTYPHAYEWFAGGIVCYYSFNLCLSGLGIKDSYRKGHNKK